MMATTMKIGINKSLLDWCLDQEWDWMLTLPLPPDATSVQVDRNFMRWITEIEEKDGDLDFRWTKLIPAQSNGLAKEFHVLVGGINSGEWSFWSRRWPVLFGWTEPVGRRAYKDRRELPSLVKRLARTDLNIQLHIGPAKIRQSRTLKVDGKGLPYGGDAMLVPESRAKTKWHRLREWGDPFNLSLPFPDEPVDSSKRAPRCKR
jgi:hypothetical protein